MLKGVPTNRVCCFLQTRPCNIVTKKIADYCFLQIHPCNVINASRMLLVFANPSLQYHQCISHFVVFCKPILALLLQRKHQTIINHCGEQKSRTFRPRETQVDNDKMEIATMFGQKCTSINKITGRIPTFVHFGPSIVEI